MTSDFPYVDTIPSDRYYYSNFIDEETEARHISSPNDKVWGQDSDLGSSCSESVLRMASVV